MRKIGFIGVGIVGKSMVCNLMKAGYEVAIYTNTRSKVKGIIDEGAIWCDNAGECAKGRQVVISIAGYPEDMEDIYFGEGGTITDTDPGTYLVDTTATSLRLAIRTYEKAKETGLHTPDAPMARDGRGAGDGALAVLAGGDREDLDACLSILQAIGRNTDYKGKAGSEQHTRMHNRITIAGAPAGAYEATVYTRDVGLDMDTMLKSVSTGAASSVQMNNVVSRALQGDYRPGFSIEYSIKDMNLADEEARAADTKLKVLENVLSMYKELEWEGMGELEAQALIKYYN